MIWLTASLSILLFLVAFGSLGVVASARSALAKVNLAAKVLGNKALSDEEKEAAVQSAAIELLGCVFAILWRSTLCFFAALAPIYLFSALGLVESESVFSFLMRWDVIIASSLIIIAFMYVASRANQSTGSYSTTDRWVHKLAFAAPFVQRAAADIEDSIFGGELGSISNRRPIFVTSLPRAGTTVVLNALHSLSGTATHTYRDMPFVAAPLLWARISKSFQKDTGLKERAHNDGIMVGVDSPEAFEEVLWKTLWPAHYRSDHIIPWSVSDMDEEGTEFFQRHFRKIAAVRGKPDACYVSKNNANIARLDLIHAMFADAQIIVPLRDPLEHAASLARQHANFLHQHADDAFTKRYMRDIGHFEFGELHRPIGFAGFKELAYGLTPADADYWLAYWIAAYDSVREKSSKLHIISLEALGQDPQATMKNLCSQVNLDCSDKDFSLMFRKITPRANVGDFDVKLVRRARALYESLVPS